MKGNKKTTKKYLALIMAAIFIVFNILACADKSDNKSDQISDNNTVESETEVDKYENAKEKYKNIESINFEGADFMIAAQAAVGTSEKEIWVETMDGDGINDAIYMRNLAINEKFNLVITLKAGDVGSVVKKSVTTGDETYKLAFPNLVGGASMAQQGYLLNFLDMENINITEQWWDQGTADLKIGNKVYFMNGDINMLDNDVTYIMLFNKQIIEDVNLEEPYQLVLDKKWTVDIFTSMIKDVTTDVNGDGKFNDSDMYGYVTTGAGPSTFFYGAGYKYVKFDSEGTPYLDINQEKIVAILEKISVIFSKDNTTRIPADVAVGKNMFMNDQVLFYGEVLSYIINIRAMETPFGVLPIPKYDENQENYYTFCEGNASTVCIPMVINDIESVSSVLEAMAIQSFITVTPAYYDIALQRKYTRDDDSAEMLDIALAHRIYDIGKLYTSIGLSEIINTLGKKGSTDFGSAYAKVEVSSQKALDKIISSFEQQNY